GLEEDSYLKLRSGFLREFKSMSALFQRCQPAPEAGIGDHRLTNSNPNRHDLIMIHDKLTSTTHKQNNPFTESDICNRSQRTRLLTTLTFHSNVEITIRRRAIRDNNSTSRSRRRGPDSTAN
ncbi:hypothetical protein, partial [Lactiplantibacillus pentosus]|uniref:hypothetical protein n=1 Tax=Lactiplantibacillus pentosus TaxID=1589 RepID=UPI0021A4EA91